LLYAGPVGSRVSEDGERHGDGMDGRGLLVFAIAASDPVDGWELGKFRDDAAKSRHCRLRECITSK
jgi:hypothetical protein